MPGQIVPAAGAKALVTPPIEGRLLPPPSGARPSRGTADGGRPSHGHGVEPPLAGPQGVQLLVNQAQIQALEIELSVKEMDVEAEINKAKIDLDFALSVYQRLRSWANKASPATASGRSGATVPARQSDVRRQDAIAGAV